MRKSHSIPERRIAVDTNVVIAALLSWHASHRPAYDALEYAFQHAQVILPMPVLVESYAVMTRLPAPHRIAPKDARTLLNETFDNSAELVTLSAQEMWRLLNSAPDHHISGGRIYDAQILACAQKARATRFLTFNERDFAPLMAYAPSIELTMP